MDVVMRLSLFLCFVGFLPLVQSGCYQKQLCCKGKNNTCKAVDDGIDHLPRKQPHFQYRHRERTRQDPSSPAPYTSYQTPYYEASGDGYDLVFPSVYEENEHSRIGKLILPDVIELEGSGADDIYGKYGPPNPDAPANLVKAPVTTTAAPRLKHLLFGLPEGPDNPPEEIRKYQDDNPKKHLLIRYSVLSQHLPLTVTSTLEEDEEDNGSNLRIQYLESAASECFCDESCVRLGDCCSDYTFVCPPRDCEVSHWSAWSACKADKGNCGLGEQERVRVVTEDAQHGGGDCPPLKEMRTCHKECPKKAEDITTVALLLDYRYNSTRSKKSRDNIYWDLPDVRKKVEVASYYCVTYEIGWVNRNCINKQLKKKLYRGNIICAECQPEAQFHRNNGRCASDLEDGDEGFWKLIGPKSCNGIWRRIERKDDCRCSIDLKEQDPFLLV